MSSPLPNTIFLVGFMASGKSRIGKALAKEMNYSFKDTDSIIESELGKSIPEIFESHGESFFRAREKAVIETLTNTDLHQVIAVGGGTPCYTDNMDLLLQKGRVLFIKPPIEHLIQRLSHSPGNRPLILRLLQSERPIFIKKLYKERLPFYSRAHHTIIPQSTIHETVTQCVTILSH